MPKKKPEPAAKSRFQPLPSPETGSRQSLLEINAVNDRMNQIILEYLHPDVWRAKPAGRSPRTIAAIFVHMHNVRRKWLRLSAPHLTPSQVLDRSRCTPSQVSTALSDSAQRCSEMLVEALGHGRVREFLRDGWARPWTPGVAMVAYMLAHEAHHRGQICMLAHQLGFSLPPKATSEMWCWERLWKQCGFAAPH